MLFRSNVKRLVVSEARVDGGPMFKRVRPRARGMAHVIKKRMAHIHIELDDLSGSQALPAAVATDRALADQAEGEAGEE